MVQTFAKRLAVSLSTHFNSTDFDCHCKRRECDLTIVSEELVEALELLWEVAGPFKIDSGFRCEAHNKEIGGATSSQHRLGTAADCKSIDGKVGSEMAAAAESVPAFHSGGIGTYPTFAHCDVRQSPARWKSGLKPSTIVAC